MTTDLALVTEVDDQNPVVGDLRIDGVELVMVQDEAATAQEAQTVLRWWHNEWFLDPDRGTPYLDEILKRGVTESSVEAVLRAQLASVPDLSRDVDIVVEIDRSTRHMSATVDGRRVI